MYGNLGPYYGAVALGKGVGVPSPFEEVARGYFLYGDNFARSYVEGTSPPPVDTDLGEGAGTPSPTQSSSTPTSKLGGTSLLGKALDYVEEKITDYMAFPEAVNPLTGTVRATGVSKAVGAMMPGFFGPLMEAGQKYNMENLSRIADMSQVSDEYSTGLMGNQLVGVEPTSETFAGKIADFFGFDLEGYTLSGNVGGFTNVDQDVYEDALITSLLANQPTAYGPGRAVAMGLDPQVTYSQTENKYNVATLLGIDPFGPNPGLATDTAFQGFTVGGEGRPDSTRPGSIVGSYDPSGNWAPVTNPYSGYAFSNMPAGTSKKALEDAGFSFFERPGGQFEMYSPDTGFGPGGGKGSPHAGTAQSQANQGGGRDDPSPGGGATESQREGFSKEGGPGGSPFNKGGRVGYAMGTPKVTKGFINKDPDSVTDEQSIADNRYTSVPEGTMIMNQPSNDKYEKQLDKLVAEAKRNVKLSDKRPKMVDVALSDGERSIHPEYVAYIEKKMGKGYLEKLNDEGKPEVSRRQAKYGSKVGASSGGFIEKQGMEIIDQPSGGINQLNEIYNQYKNKFKSPEIARKKAKELFKSLPAEDALALVMMGEASILGDEGMRGVAHVIMNRTDSDFEDFSKLNSVFDVVTQRTQGGKGIYQFNALEPRTLRQTLKDITQTDYGRSKYQKLRNDAEEILAGIQDDFTQGSLFFWNPKTSTDKSFRQKVESGEWTPTAETTTNLGQHQYLIPESIRQLPVN